MYKHSDIDLEPDNMVKVTFPQIAHAGPLDSSMGIAIYDELSKSGYITYIYGGPSHLIKKTIDLALSEFKDIKKLKVGASGANKLYLTGNTEWDATLDEVAETHWAELESLVNSYDFDKNKVNLYRDPKRNMSQDLYLDCRNGEIVINSSSDNCYFTKKTKKKNFR